MRTRSRGMRGHMTGTSGPRLLEWASPKQEFCFNYGPVGGGPGVGGPILAAGGMGASKTFAFCLKALYISELFPHNRGVIARKVCKQLEQTTMKTFYKICPPEAYQHGRRADSEFYLQLNNGSEILFLHMDTEDIEGVVRGIEMNWFLWDQAEQMDEELFDLSLGRLGRWDETIVPEELVAKELAAGREWAWKHPTTGRPLPPTYAMLTSQPDSELHWLYRRFHPNSPDHKRQWPDADGNLTSYYDQGYTMVTMTSRENKFLPKQNLTELLSKDKSFVRMYVDGEWGFPEGQIHEVRPESILTYTPELIEYFRRACTLHRILDHGDSAPTACGWMATDREGNCFFYREYYQPNRLISDHRAEITRLSEGEQYEFQLADPSIFHKTMQKYGGRWSVADEYADMLNLPKDTAIFWQPADNNEMGTRNRISEYLRPQGLWNEHGEQVPRPHPISREMGFWPRLYFIEKHPDYPAGCDYIIRETKAQCRDKIGMENGRPIFSDDRAKGISDHGYDLVRYGIASRPPLARETMAAKRRGTFEQVRQEMLRFKRQGGFRILAERQRR